MMHKGEKAPGKKQAVARARTAKPAPRSAARAAARAAAVPAVKKVAAGQGVRIAKVEATSARAKPAKVQAGPVRNNVAVADRSRPPVPARRPAPRDPAPKGRRVGVVCLITLAAFTPVLIFALLALGSGKRQLTGTVTYEGQPIAQGYITFFPAEGAGNPCGTEIVDGQFTLEKFTPGKKKVLITSHPQVHVNGAKVSMLPYRSVPPNAVGNNQIMDISSATGTLSFELTKPAR